MTQLVEIKFLAICTKLAGLRPPKSSKIRVAISSKFTLELNVYVIYVEKLKLKCLNLYLFICPSTAFFASMSVFLCSNQNEKKGRAFGCGKSCLRAGYQRQEAHDL